MRREVGTPGCAQSGLTGHATLSDPISPGRVWLVSRAGYPAGGWNQAPPRPHV